MAHWYVAPAFFSPKDIVLYAYAPNGVMNAVLMVFLFEGNLKVARVAIKEREQDAASYVVDDLVIG
jgi:abortive infection bacteriophage resistance protein